MFFNLSYFFVTQYSEYLRCWVFICKALDSFSQESLQPAASSPNLEFAPAKTPEEEEGVTAYVAAAMKMQAEMECEPEGVATFGDGGIDDLD